MLFDARGERLRPAPLEVKEGNVTSVAFGPEGQIAAGYSVVGGAAAAWCSSTPGASGSDPRRWRSRRAMSRAWPSGRRARSPRDMRLGGGGGVVLFDARGERLRPAPLEVKEGYVTSVAFGPEGQIAAGYRGVGGGGGVVLFDARGERLRPAPLEVKEGYVTSVAFGPEGKIAAGYGVARRRRRGALRRPWRAAPTRAAGGQGGQCHERGLRAGGPDRRGIWRRRPRRRGALRRPWRAAPTRAAGGQGGRCQQRGLRAGGPDRRGIWRRAASAAWCSSTPVASGSDPRPWRSRRAMSGAWPSGRRARSPRDIRRRPQRRRRGALRRPWRAAPTRAAGGQGGRCHERGLRAGGQNRRGIWRRGGGGGVVLFDADPASWRRKAGQTANRNFTWLEWTRYFPETSYRRTIRSLPWPHDLPEAERKQAEAFEKEHPEGSDAS